MKNQKQETEPQAQARAPKRHNLPWSRNVPKHYSELLALRLRFCFAPLSNPPPIARPV
jgi:hypothetical protein